MLNENLKAIRKNRGMSQEELAIRLNVVRQTVSKWEKGLSVPDSDMLIKTSNILEVSVGDLLGDKTFDEDNKNELTEQLCRINEQLAIRNRRTKTILKIIGGAIIGIIILNIILIAIGSISFNHFDSDKTSVVEELVEID